MKKHQVGGICTAVLLAATLLINQPVSVSAQEKEKPAASTEAKQPRPYPFNGKLSAVDKEKKTITLLGKEKSRTLHLQSETKVEKAGKPATLEDAKVGEQVAGRVVKSPDGKELLVSLRIGPKPGDTETPE